MVTAAQTSEVLKTSEVSNRPNFISPRFVEKVGQPGDYSWITGQLEIRGNTYILHYATPETIDRFGGSIVLGGIHDASNLHNGDLVSAHGPSSSNQPRCHVSGDQRRSRGAVGGRLKDVGRLSRAVRTALESRPNW